MRHKGKAHGFTLVELLVVVSIIGLMLGLTMPSFNSMLKSQQMASAQTLIRTALTQAQAYARSHQKYAGLRFQSDVSGQPYIILIEHEPYCYDAWGNWGNVAERYVAITNVNPVALPEGIGVISLEVESPPIIGGVPETKDQYLDDITINRSCLLGANTFCVIFSPSGQLVTKWVAVREREQTDMLGNLFDLTFGSPVRVDALVEPKPRFYHDNHVGLTGWPGFNDSMAYCDVELSTSGMYIYEIEPMLSANPDMRYSEYITQLRPLLINAYTGKLIEFKDF